MADEKQDSSQAAAVTGSVTGLNLLLTFLSLLEKILPAFLVAWNNTLQQKNKELAVKLERAKLDKDVTAFKVQEAKDNDQKSSTDIINEFLSSQPSTGDAGNTVNASPKDASGPTE